MSKKAILKFIVAVAVLFAGLWLIVTRSPQAPNLIANSHYICKVEAPWNVFWASDHRVVVLDGLQFSNKRQTKSFDLSLYDLKSGVRDSLTSLRAEIVQKHDYCEFPPYAFKVSPDGNHFVWLGQPADQQTYVISSDKDGGAYCKWPQPTDYAYVSSLNPEINWISNAQFIIVLRSSRQTRLALCDADHPGRIQYFDERSEHGKKLCKSLVLAGSTDAETDAHLLRLVPAQGSTNFDLNMYGRDGSPFEARLATVPAPPQGGLFHTLRANRRADKALLQTWDPGISQIAALILRFVPKYEPQTAPVERVQVLDVATKKWRQVGAVPGGKTMWTGLDKVMWVNNDSTLCFVYKSGLYVVDEGYFQSLS